MSKLLVFMVMGKYCTVELYPDSWSYCIQYSAPTSFHLNEPSPLYSYSNSRAPGGLSLMTSNQVPSILPRGLRQLSKYCRIISTLSPGALTILSMAKHGSMTASLARH